MPSLQNFQFVTHNNINKQRWDHCVANAANSLVYGHSFYLDGMCPGWHALIGDNYEWVWPVIARKKYGIAYLYQPNFTQQSGPFFLAGANKFNWQPVIETLQQKFRFWEVNINYLTGARFFKHPFEAASGTNLVLDLKPDYSTLEKKFSNDLVRNLKQSNRARLVYRECHNYGLAIQTYDLQYASRMPQVTPADFNRFGGVITIAGQKGMVVCRQVIDQKNELMAIALFLNDGKRLYNIMNSTTEAGKKCSANHFLLKELIVEFAGRGLLLDFEGSDLPGVKAFYENFGAYNQPFLKVKYNALPWPLRLLKR